MLNRAALLVPLALLAGCATARPAGPATVRPSQETIALVIRAGSYGADVQALDTAELRLTERCLADDGMPLRLTGDGSTVDVDEEWKPDLTRRRVVGYGIGRTSSPRTADRFLMTQPAAIRNRYQEALYGPPNSRATLALPNGVTYTYPTRGCVADARAAIYGDVAAAAEADGVPQVLWLRLYEAVRHQPQYAAATQRWSDCMLRHRFRFRDFAAARAAVAAGSRQRPDPQEVPTALADGRCTVAVGFPATVSGLLRIQVAALPPADLAQLNSAAAARRRGVDRARALLH